MWRDLAYAARALLRTRRDLSLVAILCLALGIGTVASMFSVLDSVLLQPPAGVDRPREGSRPRSADQF